MRLSVRPVRMTSSISSSGVAILVVASVLALIGGLAAALGGVLIVAILAALIIGLGVISSPKVHITLAMLIALVVTGLLEFFASFGQANWMSSLISGSLLITVFVRAFGLGRPSVKLGLTALLITLYFSVLAFSSIVNGISVPQALVGTRSYLPYLGVAAVMAWGGLDEKTDRLLFRLLILIALLQVPFTLLQHFVVGPWRSMQRGTMGRTDEAIVGTFGGHVLTGGYTGEMASFLVMVMVLLGALRRDRLVGSGLAFGAIVLLLIPILISETKVSLVLIPICFAIGFSKEIRRNPKFAFSALLVGSLLFSVILATYYIKYWGSGSVASQQLGYSFDPNFMVTPDHRGRVGTVVHWYQTNVEYGSVTQSLIGHGVASSIEGSLTIGMGSAVKLYGLGLDSHAMSRLLWDGGVVALLLFMAICVRTAWVAWRVANSSRPGYQRAFATFAASAAVAMTLMIPYQVSTLGGSAMQFLFWFVVGLTEKLRMNAEADAKRRGAS